MTIKSASEIQGREFDWLACDSCGNVALFSTAGAGHVPISFLQDTEIHDEAIRTLLLSPASTTALYFPNIKPWLTNTWRLAAERGLFAYDCSPNGGRYTLVAAPQTPSKRETFDAIVLRAAATTKFNFEFSRNKTVDAKMIDK